MQSTCISTNLGETYGRVRKRRVIGSRSAYSRHMNRAIGALCTVDGGGFSVGYKIGVESWGTTFC